METNSVNPNEINTSELTVIAHDAKITGTLEIRSDLHFFGQINGEIKGYPGSIIYLKEGSLVEGKISAETVVVEGFVKGYMHCTGKVTITSYGRLVGSIKTASLVVEPGAIFEADVGMT